MVQQRPEKNAVALAETIEAPFEAGLDSYQRSQPGGNRSRFIVAGVVLHVAVEPHYQRRHQCPRQDVAGQHGEHHRLRQRHKQVVGHPGQEEHRHEHNTDAKGRDEGRHRDLLRAVQNGVVQRFARCHVPVDVLDGHRRIINQDSDRQRQAAQGHEIDRLAQRAQNGNGSEHRQRDGQRDDKRAAPRTQEQQNHQCRERGGDDPFPDDAGDGRPDEDGLVGKLLNAQVRGNAAEDARQGLFDAADYVERGSGAVLIDGEQRAPHAFIADNILLRLVAVPHLRHVPDADKRAIDGLDGEVAQLCHFLGRIIEIHGVFTAADFGGAAGQNQVLGVEGVDHINRRQVLGLEGGQVEVHRHYAVLAAVGPGHGRALHRGQANADLVGGQVEDGLLGKLRAADAVLQDCNGGGAVADDQRRRRARRHRADNRLRDCGHLRDAGVHGSALAEKDFDDADAVISGGLGMLDVVDQGGERALGVVVDALLHLLRVQAGVLPDDAYDGDVNGRKDVRWRAQEHERRKQQQHQRRHHEGIGPP